MDNISVFIACATSVRLYTNKYIIWRIGKDNGTLDEISHMLICRDELNSFLFQCRAAHVHCPRILYIFIQIVRQIFIYYFYWFNRGMRIKQHHSVSHPSSIDLKINLFARKSDLCADGHWVELSVRDAHIQYEPELDHVTLCVPNSRFI